MDLNAHIVFYRVEEVMPNKKSAKRRAADEKKKAAKKLKGAQWTTNAFVTVRTLYIYSSFTKSK